MTGSPFRTVRSLSIYVNPASSGFMVILKAFFDDSGDAKNPEHRLLTIGGYLSDFGSWDKFEPAWRAVLDQASVPYLHMSEFWDRDGLYKDLKNDPAKEAAFFGSLIEVIRSYTRFCTYTTVLLDDLKQFNKDHRLRLNAYGLAIYGCLMGLQAKFPRQPIEVLFDKLDRAHELIQKGLDYAESDTVRPLNKKQISATHARGDESWRNILPLQAADLLAWEARKNCVDWLPWIGKRGIPFVPQSVGIQDHNDWARRFTEEHGRPPRDRKSFAALKVGTCLEGYTFNYDNLEMINQLHKLGWKLKKSRRLVSFSGASGA